MKPPINIPQRKKHRFLSEIFEITQWSDILPFYERLLARDLSSLHVLKQWFLDRSELEGAVSEEAGWRYINMTRDTTHQ